MRFVKTADARPNYCFVYPQLGSQHSRGYLDPENDLTCIDPHPYLSVQAVEDACRELGWPTADEHQHLQSQVNEQAQRIVELEEQLTEANAEIDAVYVLRSKKWTPAKKPGRPKKDQEVAA